MGIQIATGCFGAEDLADWYTRGMQSVVCSKRLSDTRDYAEALVIDSAPFLSGILGVAA